MDDGTNQDPLGVDPLRDDSPEMWDRLVEALAPASMLLCIHRRMGSALLDRLSPEDVWQETLLHVWRDRGTLEWRGLQPFRRWVLQVAENRIRNAVDRERAVKRGSGAKALSFDGAEPGELPPPVSSTTPSRVASYMEEADLMRDAAENLPEEVREVVWLRLFEELPVEVVSRELGLGVSAVKHRFRKGAQLYAASLQRVLDERTRS